MALHRRDRPSFRLGLSPSLDIPNPHRTHDLLRHQSHHPHIHPCLSISSSNRFRQHHRIRHLRNDSRPPSMVVSRDPHHSIRPSPLLLLLPLLHLTHHRSIPRYLPHLPLRPRLNLHKDHHQAWSFSSKPLTSCPSLSCSSCAYVSSCSMHHHHLPPFFDVDHRSTTQSRLVEVTPQGSIQPILPIETDKRFCVSFRVFLLTTPVREKGRKN